MASPTLQTKSIPFSGTSNKCVVIPPRSSASFSLNLGEASANFGNWAELRVGMFFDFEGWDGGEIREETEGLISNSPTSHFHFGIKNNSAQYPGWEFASNTTTPALGGPWFLGITGDASLCTYNANGPTYYNNAYFTIGIVRDLYSGAKPRRGIKYVRGSSLNKEFCPLGMYWNSSTTSRRAYHNFSSITPNVTFSNLQEGSLYSPDAPYTSGAGMATSLDFFESVPITSPQRCLFVCFKILVSDDTISLFSAYHPYYQSAWFYKGEVSSAALEAAMSNITFPPTATATVGNGLGAHLLVAKLRTATANCIFVANPFAMNNLRVHAIGVKKFA